MTSSARHTPSGVPVDAAYRPSGPDPRYERVGDPGTFPYTRGIFPAGFRDFAWMESFASGFGLPESTNRRERQMHRFGHSGYDGRASMNLVFDRPTFEGYDSDDPMARHEVGEVGVIVDSIHDVGRIVEGFDLASLNIGLIVDRSGAPIFAMYVAVADRRGVSRDRLRGIVTNNPLEAYFISRMRVFPPRATLRMIADVTRFALREAPHFNTCRVNGYSLRESGCTAVQEVAFALSKAIAVVEECDRRGIAPAEVGGRMSFQFAQDSYFFEEICKIRAARRLWATILRNRFGVTDDRACRMKIHMQTSGASLTSQEPANNIVRVALQTLSAALAGPQSIHVCAFDEALGIPTEEAVKLAIKTSKIVQHETGVADSVDPLAGSYLVEELTDRLQEAVEAEIARVDAMGGAIAAIENRSFEQAIVNAAYDRQRAIESGERTVVGVNAYTDDLTEGQPAAIFRADPEDRRVAIERCRSLKATRDQRRAAAALDRIRDAAADDDAEVTPHLLDAAVAEVTVGEMCAALTQVFGAWLEPAVFAERS
jgi:methylmalonyl-CoA mutase N-terminal domain/subunit